MTEKWRPSADWDSVRQRATALATARNFFAMRGVTEVETPVLCETGVTDPNIDSISAATVVSDSPLFLRTSPEYHMKRLLAAGSPDIFQIGKVFRDGECGDRHQPEFTMIEWYRCGFGLGAITDETCELLCELSEHGSNPVSQNLRISYTDAFVQNCSVNPLKAELDELRSAARQHLGDILNDELVASLGDDRQAWLDLLATHLVCPGLPKDLLVVVDGYPAEQAMLARINPDDPATALRFEVFLNGVELANGFHELGNAAEQAQRFALDRELRRARGRPDMQPDNLLLDALEAGLPDCSGVAVGLDRLLMVTSGQESLAAVMSFIPGRQTPS
ncbi:MAG: EF-P lysine aminoacylase EpmA [Gammaproteobacteria bacterium]|nr:EF-P lysine aminoacylase EpmA [Gammaproteobacteria bacterium]MDP6695907.1 EF-P lysine aminoacylase EpmA [Gammaproteobacteria bacterium]MDP7041845.1 EF-P lysine aminoacylase EpmA [Gammaproteobacteria bacterium]